MAEEKISCVDCGVEFLKTTADCTDGKCMPCFSGEPRENQKDLSSGINSDKDGEETTAGKWAAAIALVSGGFCMSVILFPLLGIVSGLIALYGFNSSSNTAWMVGLFTFVALKVLAMIGDVSQGANDSRSENGRKDFAKKWAEKHGTRNSRDSD